jgi:hypothetical protein
MRYYVALVGLFLGGASLTLADEFPPLSTEELRQSLGPNHSHDILPISAQLTTLTEISPDPIPVFTQDSVLPASEIHQEFRNAPDGPFRYGLTAGSVRGIMGRNFERPEEAPQRINRTGLFGRVDLRNDTWYLDTSIQHVTGNPMGASISAATGVHAISLSVVRFGIGLRYAGVKESYPLFSTPLTSGTYRGTRQFGAGGLEVGIGRYNGTYIRLGGFVGASAMRLKAELSVRGIIINENDPLPLSSTTTALRLLEVHAQRLQTFGRHTLIVNAGIQDFTLSPWNDGTNRAQYLPDRHQVIHGRATYYSPFHVGVWVDRTHASDRRGATLLKDATAFGLLLTF